MAEIKYLRNITILFYRLVPEHVNEVERGAYFLQSGECLSEDSAPLNTLSPKCPLVTLIC